MSIRTRLVLLSVVVALLPAIPLSFLVRALLEKSFTLGLSPTIDRALQSGVVVSREQRNLLVHEFEIDVTRVIEAAKRPDPGRVTAVLADASLAVDGFLVGGKSDIGTGQSGAASHTPPALGPFVEDPLFNQVVGSATLRLRKHDVDTTPDVSYFESDDRGLQMALWGNVLLYHRLDAIFVENANRVLSGLQIFSGLRLTQKSLSRSFFYPFVVVYTLMLIISLGIALFIAERMSLPLRRLADATHVVARGDWSHRVDIDAAGETGQLVASFNAMVSRLAEQREQLIESERIATWREIARYLAHEIKNPLLPIRLTAEELRDQYPGGDAKYEALLSESTRIIADEVEHLTQLVKEFSSFARMPELRPQRGSITRLMEDIAQLYPQLDVQIELDGEVPVFEFDPDQMRRVFVNLMDNVTTVVDGGGGQPQVRVVARQEGDRVVVELSDNGPGMTAETQRRIFDPYFTTRKEGTGLGLAMVKSIVLLHGGSIRVSSEPGRGATFRIELPLVFKAPPQPFKE